VAHSASNSMGTVVLSGTGGRGEWLQREVDLAPLVVRLRMSGAVSLLPLCAFRGWTEVTLHFIKFESCSPCHLW
jgi:hypothetical protein